MPSWAWVVTNITDSDIRKNVFQCPLGLELLLQRMRILWNRSCFNALSGLNCYGIRISCTIIWLYLVSMPSRAWIVTFWKVSFLACTQLFQCPLGLELLLWRWVWWGRRMGCFNALSGLNCYHAFAIFTIREIEFQCPLGLELLLECDSGNLGHTGVSMPSRAWIVTKAGSDSGNRSHVSMPSRAWIVTARMSNILNFSWSFFIHTCSL